MCGTNFCLWISPWSTYCFKGHRKEYTPALPAISTQISRPLVSPIGVGKDHVIAISCPHKWHTWHVLWHKHRSSCRNTFVFRTAVGIPLSSHLTSGLQLVEPCCRHCGRIHKCSTFFPGNCTGGDPLGKRKTPWKLNIFIPSLLPLTLIYPVYCLKNTCTVAYTWFCSSAHTENNVTWAQFCAHQQQKHTSDSDQQPR